MRKILSFLVLSSLALFTSCSDDDSVSETSQPKFSVDINGETFNADNFEAFTYAGILSITASDVNNNNTFVLSINSTSEGTFTPNTDGSLLGLAYEPVQGSADFIADPLDPNSGSLTISNLDITNGLVSGTFNFTATRFGQTFTMTNGKFIDVPLLDDIPPYFTGGVANFDLNGTAFNPTSLTALRSQFFDEDRVVISMRKQGSATFQIWIPTDTQPGTYDNDFDFRLLANQGQSVFSGNKTITITENNAETRVIKGTFEGVLDFDATGGSNEVFTITNGEFDVIYDD